MTREDILNKVRRCTPNFGWEHEFPELFGKYGMECHGVYEGWYWFTEDNITDIARSHGRRPLTDASDVELLTMWAMADSYWLGQYREWLKRAEKKSSKLDMFIGECERRYFGYDEDGYADKTIDRIFNSVFEALDKKLTNKGE